jgi:hypothetical protein
MIFVAMGVSCMSTKIRVLADKLGWQTHTPCSHVLISTALSLTVLQVLYGEVRFSEAMVSETRNFKGFCV